MKGKYELKKKGVQAKMSHAEWLGKSIAERKQIAREAEESILKRGGKKLVKKVPVLGLVFIVTDIRDKGAVGGVANNLLDQVPWLGWAKTGHECLTGDWIPDKE